MSDVSHGVNASKTNNGAITPVSVDTGVHFVVGTAPVQMVNGKVPPELLDCFGLREIPADEIVLTPALLKK